jgi:hypothetical protein
VVRLPPATLPSVYIGLFTQPPRPDELLSVTCTADEISVLLPTRLNTLVGADYKLETDWTVLKVSLPSS